LDDADRIADERIRPSGPTPNPWYWSQNESADNSTECNSCKNGNFKENYNCFPCDMFLVKGFSAHDQAYSAQSRNFPNGGGDPYSGGYRHCVSSCILTKRYGPVGQIGRHIWDFANEDSTGLWKSLGYKPSSDSNTDIQAEDYGRDFGYSSCESCEYSCLKQYPAYNFYDWSRGK
jgi:hypothetical protein